MKIENLLAACSALLLITCNQKPDKPGQLQLLESTFIFSKAPFASCHASTLVALPGGRIMAAWFGGKQEGDSGVTIWNSVLEKGKWSEPSQVADGIQPDNKQFACWNPVLFYPRNSTLFLFYRVGKSPATWWSEVKTSADTGKTWSEPQVLHDGLLGPIKNKPVQLSNGDILFPSSIETVTGNKWTIHLERYDSTNDHWKKIDIDCDTFSVIQPTLLTYGKDSIQLLCRSRNNVIVQSWSFDNGQTWQRVTPTALPNPNSGIDAVTLGNGQQLLVYNPTRQGPNGRSILRVAISSNGQDWKDYYDLEEAPDGEFSYPAVIQTEDGTIHITYTYNREKIKYARLKF